MTFETISTLNTNTLIGFTDKRGHAWHYKAQEQGAESNHYPGAIPVEHVTRRLFDWAATSRRVAVEVPATFEDMTHLAEDGTPMKWAVQLDRQAIARDDNNHVMGMFKDGYQPHQYKQWLLDTVANLLDDDLSIGSAGLLRQGAVAWVQVEVPDTITTPEGVSFRPNLLGCTSFDGSIATTFKRTITVVVCDNTLEAARGERGQQFKAKHTKNSGFKLASARQALGIIHQAADDFTAQVAELCATTVTDKQWLAFLEAYVPVTEDGKKKEGRALTMAINKQDTLKKLWNHDQRVSPWKGTSFGVLQAVNTYDHHEGIVRGGTRAERNMMSAVKGEQGKADDAAMELLGRILTNA